MINNMRLLNAVIRANAGSLKRVPQGHVLRCTRSIVPKIRAVSTTTSDAGSAGTTKEVSEKKPEPEEEMLSKLPEYPLPGTLEPANEADYEKFVAYWRSHFIHCNDRYELDRGLNMIFTCDWVPDVRVIEDAIKACRRLSDFPVATRIVVCLEKCAYNSELYREYMVKLKPLLEELGIPERSELGEFKMTFKRIPWMQ